MRTGMKGPLIAAVCGVALGLAAVPVDARHFAPPPEAQAWIGTWHTNQGDFRFNEVYNCQSGPEFGYGEPGKPNGACALDGEWRHGGGTWQVILGNVSLGPRYKGETWEGCFRTPDYLPGHECTFNGGGSMLLFRNRDRFTGGYWKACGLGAGCPSHHPIQGAKVSNFGGHEPECPTPSGATEPSFGTGPGCPDYTVNVLFHVDGFPDAPLPKDLPPDLVSVEIQSFGATLTWNPVTKKWKAQGDITMTDTYLDQQSSPTMQDKQVTIRIDDAGPARFKDRGYERDISLPVTVERSEDPQCPEGKVTIMALGVKRDEASLTMPQSTSRPNNPDCLSAQPLAWLTHHFKQASISRPVPAT